MLDDLVCLFGVPSAGWDITTIPIFRLIQNPGEEISWIDVSCLTASRRRLCLPNAVAYGLPLNEMRYEQNPGSRFGY